MYMYLTYMALAAMLATLTGNVIILSYERSIARPKRGCQGKQAKTGKT